MCEKTRGFGAESPAQVLLIGWNLPRVGRRRSEACIPCCQNGKVTKISQAPGWNCYSPGNPQANLSLSFAWGAQKSGMTWISFLSTIFVIGRSISG